MQPMKGFQPQYERSWMNDSIVAKENPNELMIVKPSSGIVSGFFLSRNSSVTVEFVLPGRLLRSNVIFIAVTIIET